MFLGDDNENAQNALEHWEGKEVGVVDEIDWLINEHVDVAQVFGASRHPGGEGDHDVRRREIDHRRQGCCS